MTAPPAGPATVEELVLHVGRGVITAAVLKFADGTVRLRLTEGGGDVGLVLDAPQIGALRAMLGDALGVMFTAERRAA